MLRYLDPLTPSGFESTAEIISMQFTGASRLESCRFGALVELGGSGFGQFLEKVESNKAGLLDLFYSVSGLLVIRGANEISTDPGLLVKLSEFFGPEVENYRTTITTDQFFHESENKILVLSNRPPCNFEPPPRPDPMLAPSGGLPVRYPHRKGWHTDQGYRRPPPDITLLYGVTCPPPDQGQTIYADGVSAYRSLDQKTRDAIQALEGIHSIRWVGRSACEVRSNAPVKALLPHQRPQKQPVVRIHPVTGDRALYLCDEGQMDFIDGPFQGMEKGLDGAGHQLLDKLVAHLTQEKFTYIHNWQAGDLVIHDNRMLPHTATWYDSHRYTRLMWRSTVMGNPGKEYAGERKSWIPDCGTTAMEGLEDLEF